MSKLLSLKLKDDVYRQAEKIARGNRMPKNKYFNDAIALYNMLWQRRLLKRRLEADSRLVARDSLETLAVLERLEDKLD